MENTIEYKRWHKPGIPTTRFLLDFYDACLREDSPQKVAQALGASKKEVYSWVRKSEILKEAQALADTRRGNRSSIQGYVYGFLSEEAKEMWDTLTFWKDTESTYERMEKIFSGKTVRLRQELFIHALVSSNYDVSNACKMVGVNRATLREWQNSDMAFKQLFEEIQWHKKNFFERHLIGLVEENHPAAVLFVNRTVNADRGYTEKLQIEHTGGLKEGLIDIDELKLDLDTRRKILEAVREAKIRKASEEARSVNGDVVVERPMLTDVEGEPVAPAGE
jgi:transposase